MLAKDIMTTRVITVLEDAVGRNNSIGIVKLPIGTHDAARPS